MRVAVATSKGGSDDTISNFFGRCPTCTFVECEEGSIVKAEVLDNTGASSAEGAGKKTAQFLVKNGADVVVSGNFGPHSVKVLSSSGVKLVQAQGNVRETLGKYLAGDIKEVSRATVKEDYCKEKEDK